MKKLIIIVLIIGVIYRLFLTANGNFLFNMDNARDMVDVREMVVLKKLRLTGPTSAIEGLYNGPGWYYFLAVPFLLSGGDPYSAILMEIVLWAIGGFFLLKLVSKWGVWLILPIGALWVASDYIVLANLYAFNPNPIILLTPLFIYLLIKYLEKGKMVYGALTWFLAGLFFNFEMNFGIFTPVIILFCIIMTKNTKFLRQKGFWIGLSVFVLALLPQAIFDLKHQFIMSKAVLKYLSEHSGNNLNFFLHFKALTDNFYNVFSSTLMNHKIFTLIILIVSIPVVYNFIKNRDKERLVLVGLAFVAIPFLGYLILPVNVNPWHLGGEMAASLIFIAYILKKLMEGGIYGKAVSIILATSIILFGLLDIRGYFVNSLGSPNLDPSLYRNEIAAIDYVYKYANGQNFKVYIFMPSVYDYPYQYLFWWYGRKKYGYIPAEYAYAPNKPAYISNKDKFEGSKANYEGLVFLIKEPNRGYNWKSGWEASYKSMELLSSEKLGSIEIEVRSELKIP